MIALLDFSQLLPYCYQSSNFAITKVVALWYFYTGFVHWFMASFLYCYLYSYRSLLPLKEKENLTLLPLEREREIAIVISVRVKTILGAIKKRNHEANQCTKTIKIYIKELRATTIAIAKLDDTYSYRAISNTKLFRIYGAPIISSTTVTIWF